MHHHARTQVATRPHPVAEMFATSTVAFGANVGASAAPGRRRVLPPRPGGIYALKPIGRSPAYMQKEEPKEKRNPVVNLFGNGEAKARIAQLKYELENGTCPRVLQRRDRHVH